jgi:hypothetical protein
MVFTGFGHFQTSETSTKGKIFNFFILNGAVGIFMGICIDLLKKKRKQKLNIMQK